MGWLDTFLMGTHAALAADIENLDDDLRIVRNRQQGQSHTDDMQFEALLLLRKELTQTRLVVAGLAHILLEKGVLDRAALEEIIAQLETPSAQLQRKTK